MFRVYFVSETAQVELRSGRVKAPACCQTTHRRALRTHSESSSRSTAPAANIFWRKSLALRQAPVPSSRARRNMPA